MCIERFRRFIENFVGRPEWYRELPESKKCIAKPALDELVKVIKGYFELRALSKEEALNYVRAGYLRIEEEINSLENSELKKTLKDYCKRLVDILLK